MLLLAIVCLFASVSKTLHAQAIPLLTDPLKIQEIELLSEKLDMTSVQKESMLDLYDRYLVDFARVRNGDVKTFEDSITEAAENFGFMSLNIPEREEVEKLITQFDRSIRSIQRVDKLFFDEIGGMMTETQQRRLERYQIAREVEAFMALELVAEMNRGARSHISELFDHLRVEESLEVLQILETYEKRYLNLSKSTYDALIETVKIGLDMIDELEVRGLDQQALMMKFMNEEAIEDLKQRGDILLIPIQEVAFEISQLNWKTWKLLDALLPDEEAMKLQQLYFSKSYSDAVLGFKLIDKYIERALELDKINEDQKLSLVELHDSFNRRFSSRSEKHAAIIEKSREHRSIAQLSNEVAGEYDQELDDAKLSRDALVESTEKQIDNILGFEIVQALKEDDKENTVEMKFSKEVEVQSTKSGSNVSVEITTGDEEQLVGGVEIPKPIAPSFSKRASTILGLQDSGTMIIEAVYDEYREDYDTAYAAVRDAGDSIQDDSTLSGGARLRKVRDASKEAAQSVALLDTEFFDDLAAVTSLERDSATLLMLEHHRARQRQEPTNDRYGWSGGRNAVVDLVDLFVVSKEADDVSSQLSPESVETLRDGMKSYHQSIAELHSNLIQARYNLAHMEDAMYLIEESDDDATNARMAESIQRRWRDAFIAIRDANSAIVSANQHAMEAMLGKLQEDDYWVVRMKYVRTAYPDIFKDSRDASTMLTAALAIQGIETSQQSSLEHLSASYKYDYWNLSEEMVKNRQSDGDTDRGEKFFTQEDMRREIQLETLRFERRELNDRVRMRLRMILDVDQIKDVPGLHASIAAARDAEKQ